MTFVILVYDSTHYNRDFFLDTIIITEGGYMILVKDLVKRYKELVALDHMNLEVRDGEILGLLGPNGSGKTTLINCILSLLHYDKGEVQVFNQSLYQNSYDLKRKIGYIPQEVSVMPTLTVYENIDFFCSLYISDKKTRKKYVQEAIDFVELNKYKKFTPKKLSGGLKRRLNIACGIAHKPELIFFDEPTVAVDAQSRNFILDGIKRLNKEGATIVYSSHYLEEVEMLCDRIVIMDRGRNIASGTIDEVKDSIRTSEKIYLSFLEIHKEQINQLRKIQGLINLEVDGNDLVLYFEKENNNLVYILNFIEDENLTYTKLSIDKPSLNDVFLTLTGKELRDNE